MRWKSGRRSSNIEDRRYSNNGRSNINLGRSGNGTSGLLTILMRVLPFLLKTKLGKVALGVGVVAFFGAKLMGIDLLSPGDKSLQEQHLASTPKVTRNTSAQSELVDFVSVVLADTETTWHSIFASMGLQYEEPKLVIFAGSVSSACGHAQAAMGPFYCPGDRKMYIDLTFYDDLKSRFGAPGDFAQAYVIGHEVGHHVQTLLGISSKVHAQKQRLSKVEANQLSVKQELQADCFAGLWAHSADTQRNLLENGDLDEALAAAAATGDDRLQKQFQGYVIPESFTHGTSVQRKAWFKRGFDSGDITQCDTFSKM